MTMQAEQLTIRKTVMVNCSIEHAFETFTDRIHAWWPVETHSIHKQATPVLEGRAGGRLYERTPDGREEFWAEVLAWEPPHRVALAWKVNPDAPAATDLEVRFVPEGKQTRVELEHSGWERFGEQAAEARGSYDEGWESVLGRFVEAANR